jgi:hypothetical protein
MEHVKITYLYTHLLVEFVITCLYCHSIYFKMYFNIIVISTLSLFLWGCTTKFLYAFPGSPMRAVTNIEAPLRFYTVEAFHPLIRLSDVIILPVHALRNFMKHIRSLTNTFCTVLSVLPSMKFTVLSIRHVSWSERVYPDTLLRKRNFTNINNRCQLIFHSTIQRHKLHWYWHKSVLHIQTSRF